MSSSRNKKKVLVNTLIGRDQTSKTSSSCCRCDHFMNTMRFAIRINSKQSSMMRTDIDEYNHVFLRGFDDSTIETNEFCFGGGSNRWNINTNSYGIINGYGNEIGICGHGLQWSISTICTCIVHVLLFFYSLYTSLLR